MKTPQTVRGFHYAAGVGVGGGVGGAGARLAFMIDMVPFTRK